MEQKDKKQFGALLLAVGEVFRVQVSTVMLELYFNSLSDIPLNGVKTALEEILATFEWFPKPCDIRSIVGTNMGEINTKGLAQSEWLKLLEAISNGEPANLHPTTALVVRALGGWESCRMWETKYLDFKRREFLELWESMHGKEQLLQLGANEILSRIENKKYALTV